MQPRSIMLPPFDLPHGFTLFSGTLKIDLIVDQSGNFVANGNGVTITTNSPITIDGATFSGTLLTGTVTAFGSQSPGPPPITFDGLFTITGGSLTGTNSGVFGGFSLGGTGGFLLDAEHVTGGTLGDFTHNFSASSVKPTVGVAAPEPSTFVIMLFGAALFVSWQGARYRISEALQ